MTERHTAANQNTETRPCRASTPQPGSGESRRKTQKNHPKKEARPDCSTPGASPNKSLNPKIRHEY
ncbi:hypothetical protein TSUD_143130 [Trifolium subterraneum]|uniref:Uncharacterized protein n=1 Tax=Trifolium subterraneum TaxID=3900 RepID=A0A2Z6NS80_TRISU|nr:hypothetical protein TSUD_143130 [Trifolium subterraneum]